MWNNDQFYNIWVKFEVIVTRLLPKYAELKCEFDCVDNLIFQNFEFVTSFYPMSET